jgi:hypothetical protein
MTTNSYSIHHSNGLTSLGYVIACSKCGRKSLMEMMNNGSTHHTTPTIICGDCLDIGPEFKEKYPGVAKQIKEALA